MSVCLDFPCLDSFRCLDFKKNCPLSACTAKQGRDKAVRTFTIFVCRRLLHIGIILVTEIVRF